MNKQNDSNVGFEKGDVSEGCMKGKDKSTQMKTKEGLLKEKEGQLGFGKRKFKKWRTKRSFEREGMRIKINKHGLKGSFARKKAITWTSNQEIKLVLPLKRLGLSIVTNPKQTKHNCISGVSFLFSYSQLQWLLTKQLVFMEVKDRKKGKKENIIMETEWKKPEKTMILEKGLVFLFYLTSDLVVLCCVCVFRFALFYSSLFWWGGVPPSLTQINQKYPQNRGANTWSNCPFSGAREDASYDLTKPCRSASRTSRYILCMALGWHVDNLKSLSRAHAWHPPQSLKGEHVSLCRTQGLGRYACHGRSYAWP